MMAVVAAAEKLHASHVAAADDVATKQAAAAKRAKRAKVLLLCTVATAHPQGHAVWASGQC